MSPPLLTVAAQGLGVVPADQLNTYVQWAVNFDALRTFTGLANMTVFAEGAVTPGDGGQGTFYYTPTGAYVDNDSTVIVPTGATQGAWLLIPPGENPNATFETITVTGTSHLEGPVTLDETLSVAGVATFESDVVMTGTGELQLPAGTTGERSGSPVLGMTRYNITTNQFEGYGSSGWQPLGAATVEGLGSVGGRPTLTSGAPVMSSAVIGSANVYFTPYLGDTIPVWNGSAFLFENCPELTCVLADGTFSPAPAASASVYDLFVWNNGTNFILSRGPAWSNTGSRGYSLSLVNGIAVNAASITNGPAAGFGVHVMTIWTDASTATVTYNPFPAAASGGPAGGAWIGLWSRYNRVVCAGVEQDIKASWTYNSTTWRPADGGSSNLNNRVSFIVGAVEDAVHYSYIVNATFNSVVAGAGVGLNSTTTPLLIAQGNSTDCGATLPIAGDVLPALGANYVQALEAASGNANYHGAASSFANAPLMQLSVQFRY